MNDIFFFPVSGNSCCNWFSGMSFDRQGNQSGKRLWTLVFIFLLNVVSLLILFTELHC